MRRLEAHPGAFLPYKPKNRAHPLIREEVVGSAADQHYDKCVHLSVVPFNGR